MDLEQTLERLTELLPERVRKRDEATHGEPLLFWQAYFEQGWYHLWRVGEIEQSFYSDLAMLEYALREECEARGWNWEVARKGTNPNGTWQYWGHIWHPRSAKPEVARLADTPAHALALALIEALEAETP